MPGLNAKYLYRQLFDATKLITGISEFLSTQPLAQGNGPDSAANAAKTINRLSLDARVNDIRFMACMLATIMAEARETQPYERPVLKKGIQQVDPKTKLPLTKTVQLWDLFDPATEMGFGKGRDYYEPVKVAQIVDGAIITEKDGQQLKVDLAGNKFVDKGTSTLLRSAHTRVAKLPISTRKLRGTSISTTVAGLYNSPSGTAMQQQALRWDENLNSCSIQKKCSNSTHRMKWWWLE
jgi:hypothetical protein